VSEWLKVPVLKTGIPTKVSGVRILPYPCKTGAFLIQVRKAPFIKIKEIERSSIFSVTAKDFQKQPFSYPSEASPLAAGKVGDTGRVGTRKG
jgi:hypothetical protein